MSGKGSKRRKGEKIRKYRENFDQINWKKPKLTKEQMAELLLEVKNCSEHFGNNHDC